MLTSVRTLFGGLEIFREIAREVEITTGGACDGL